MLLSDYVTDVRNLVHDPSGADFTNPTLIGFINTARNQLALDTQCVQTYLPGLNTITQQEQYPLTGFVGGVAMIGGGTGYGNGATIGFTGGGGTGAAAIAVISGGVITGINMTNWGASYTSAPGVVITPVSGGSGASATAIVGVNIINWLQPVDVLWGSLRINFDYLTFTNFNSFARAYMSVFSRPGVFTVHLGNQAAFLYPVPDQAYPMAINASIYPTPLVNLTDLDSQVISPWNTAVKFYAAFLCMASLQQFQAAQFWYQPDARKPLGQYDMRIRQLPAAVTPYRIFNPYRLGARRVRRT